MREEEQKHCNFGKSVLNFVIFILKCLFCKYHTLTGVKSL